VGRYVPKEVPAGFLRDLSWTVCLAPQVPTQANTVRHLKSSISQGSSFCNSASASAPSSFKLPSLHSFTSAQLFLSFIFSICLRLPSSKPHPSSTLSFPTHLINACFASQFVSSLSLKMSAVDFEESRAYEGLSDVYSLCTAHSDRLLNLF
jgi:hypothetical protein